MRRVVSCSLRGGGSRGSRQSAAIQMLSVLSAQKKKTSVASLDPEGLNADVGDQVLVAGQKHGVVRFFGKTDFAPGRFTAAQPLARLTVSSS